MEFQKEKNFLRKKKDNHPLQNRTEPELYRDIFPYNEVPKIVFDDHIVTFDVPEHLFITDTTFRDGQQAREPFTVNQMVDIYKLMNKLDGGSGLIRQTEFFMYSDKDKEALEKILELGLKYPQPTGWIRAQKKDFELVKQFELKETGILTSVSDYHIYMKLKMDRQQALDFYVDMAAHAIENGVIPRCHFEDITRADIFGFAVPLAQKLMELSKQSGMPVKIRLCDTMGYGISYPGATLPRGIGKLVHAFKSEAGVPSEWLEWHGHNDFHKVLVNTTAAWLHGVSGANCALLGLGERTGNCPLEGMVMEYAGLFGLPEEVDTKVITEIRDYFNQPELQHFIPKNFPFVGDDFNITRAGIHVDGLVKNEEIYNIFDTTQLLDRPIGVSITDKSGTAGIIHWLNKHYPKASKVGITKKHPKVIKIYDWILDQYNHGRVTSIADAEMDKLIHQFLPELTNNSFADFKERIKKTAFSIIEESVENEAFKTMDPKKIEPVLIKLANSDPALKLLSVVNAEGRKVTKNVTQLEYRKAYEHKLIDDDFTDRIWFQKTINNGETNISDIYMSKITEGLTITVSTPIFDESDHIIGVLALDFNFDEFAQEIH